LRERVGALVDVEDVLVVPPVRLTTVPDFETAVFSFTTDIPFLTRWGAPLLLGPGSVTLAHTDAEHIAWSELERAVELYAGLARSFDVVSRDARRRLIRQAVVMSTQLWRAVLDRDPNADGLFVYAVRSTKIYCRPTCASRRPRRDRVEFFPAAAMAEAAGYRACRRCHPERAFEGPAALARVRHACRAIARQPAAPWQASSLARAGGTSVVQLQRAFRSVLGLSPREYITACRRRRFIERLRQGARVTDAVYEAGFGSASRAYEAIRLPGMTPATYGRGGAGAAIGWATTGLAHRTRARRGH
jgi:methylphosphotriester-DNA--protein-cysteine methyltransferase